MQMCAWRKLLDVEQSINSRNLGEWLWTLTLVSAGSGVCFRALPSSIVFFYRTFFFWFFFVLVFLFVFFNDLDISWLWECVVTVVSEPWEVVSWEIFNYVALIGAHCGASFPPQPQQSILVSAVILLSYGERSWPRGMIFMQNSDQLWDPREIIPGPLPGSRGRPISSTPDEFCFLSFMYILSFFKKTLVLN